MDMALITHPIPDGITPLKRGISQDKICKCGSTVLSGLWNRRGN